MDLIGWVQQGVQNAINTVIGGGQQAATVVQNAAGSAINTGSQIVQNGGAIIGNTINQAGNAVGNTYNQGIQNLSSGLQYTTVNAGNIAGTAIQGIENIPSMAMTGIGTVGSGIQNLNTQILGVTGMGAQGPQQPGQIQATSMSLSPSNYPQIQNSPFIMGDQTPVFLNSLGSTVSNGLTLYVPYGDRAQTEVNNINRVVIDPVSGAFAAYTTPYGHSISNIVTSGGAGSLQSGMFSTKPETPVVYTQEGTFDKIYAPTAHLDDAAAVIANPSAFSRLGAEAYGGQVSLLDGRTLGDAAMGVYSAASGNLANLVNPTGVNQSKTTWSEIPWSVPISSTPGFFTVDKQGTLTGLNTTQLSSIGMTPPNLVGGKIVAGAIKTTDIPASLQSNVKGEYTGPTMYSGGLLGHWAFGDTSPEVIKGAVFSGIDSAASFFGLGTPLKSRVTETDPSLIAWRAENEINKTKMTAPEYNSFLQQSFEQGLLTKPPSSPTFVENPRLTYGYGEFSKWSYGAGDTFRNTFLGGATVAQVEQNLFNAERSGNVGQAFIAGTGKTMSEDPGQFVSGYIGGAILVGGGEIVGGLWEGSALATRVGAYALSHPTAAAIGSAAINYGIPLLMAGGIYYGASEGFTASPTRTSANLGQMLPEFTGVMLGGASAYGVVRAMDAGYLGYVTKEEKSLMIRPTTDVGTFDPISRIEQPRAMSPPDLAAPIQRAISDRPLMGDVPLQGERVGNTVYFEGWERSPLMGERGGARPLNAFERIRERPTPEYMKPLGETTVSTSAGVATPDWAQAILRVEPVATSPPPSWMDVRTAGQTIPEARPLIGDVADLPRISIIDSSYVEPRPLASPDLAAPIESALKGSGKVAPPSMTPPTVEVRGSNGMIQTLRMEPELVLPVEDIPVLDLTPKIETAVRTEGNIRISKFAEQARVEQNLYWSPENPMKLHKGYDIHNTAIKGTAPSAEGAGNWMNRQMNPEEMQGYLRIALMERTEPISFTLEAKDTGVMYGPDLAPSVRSAIEAKVSLGERPELATLQPITWEDRVAIEQGKAKYGFDLGVDERELVKAKVRLATREEVIAPPETKPVRVSVAGIDTGVVEVPGEISIPVVEQLRITTPEQERPYAPYIPPTTVNVPRMGKVPYIEPEKPYRERPIGDGILTPDRPVPERPIATTDIVPERPVPERPYVPTDKPPNVPVPPIPIIPIPPLPKLPWFPSGGGGGGGGIKGPRYKQVETFYLGPKNLKGLMKRKK